MKKRILATAVLCACLSAAHVGYQAVMADETEAHGVIYDGVSVGPVEIGGMTKEEAKEAVNNYIDEISNTKLTLRLEGVTDAEKQITVTAAELGMYWANPEIIERAAGLGDAGNIIRRYKAKKDIENNEIVFELEFAIEEATLKNVLDTNAETLSVEAKDATISKEGERFTYTDEVDGKTVDTAKAVPALTEYLTEEWNHSEATISLAAAVSEAKVTRELCESIEKEPMGSYTTSFKSSSSSRCGNIENAVKLMTGTVLLPGESFSCLEHMVPFTAENGYYLAGSYLNGKTVDSYGGGVCQVSTTLYNAVLLAELEVVQRNNHGLTVSYVPLSADAAIAESSGMDFIFKNNTNAPIYLEGYVENKTVTFNIYGHDERPANRTIKYVSSVVEEISPGADVVTVDESLPVGSQVVTQSSHTGYRAELYKHVYVDGVRQSVERVNSSYYAPSPNYVTRGPEDPNAVVEETNPDGTPVIAEPAVDANGNPADSEASAETSAEAVPGETTAAPEIQESQQAPAETPGMNETAPAEPETPGITPVPQETPGISPANPETPGIQETPGITPETMEEIIAVG